MEEIESNGIKIYPLPDCDSDEDEDYKEQVYQGTLLLLILDLEISASLWIAEPVTKSILMGIKQSFSYLFILPMLSYHLIDIVGSFVERVKPGAWKIWSISFLDDGS